MMRAWENRSDTQVWDEPFYAYYLTQTQRPDPLADQTIQTGITDWQQVVDRLCQSPASGLQYHKHITTHVLPGDSLDWVHQDPGMRHVFLIREPERVVASFNQLFSDADVDELESFIGFHQQQRIFDAIKKHTGDTPLVIDSSRFLTNPKQHLQNVCESLAIAFEDAMLSWPKGLRDSDGVWASHWYKSVQQSTGFGPPPTGVPTLNEAQHEVASRCRAVYENLLTHAI